MAEQHARVSGLGCATVDDINPALRLIIEHNSHSLGSSR